MNGCRRRPASSTAAIQRHWRELEGAGYVLRSRRRNHRKIYLLFDLAGRMQSSQTSNALIASDQCTAHLRYMHSSPVSSPSLRERETKILRSEGGSPSATSPGDGGSPTTTPNQKTQTDPDPVGWLEATATPDELAFWRSQLETHGLRSPLGKIARNCPRPAPEPGATDKPGDQPGRLARARSVPNRGRGKAGALERLTKFPTNPASRADMV